MHADDVLVFPSQLKALTAAMLDDFLNGKGARVQLGPENLDDSSVSFALRRDQKTGGATITDAQGPVLALWPLRLALALVSGPGDRLRRCPDVAKCNRFFLRTGRMEYCSTRCARRVYMRKWNKELYANRRRTR